MVLGKVSWRGGDSDVVGIRDVCPVMMCYYDATGQKRNTLTPNSQEVMSKLEGNDDHEIQNIFTTQQTVGISDG